MPPGTQAHRPRGLALAAHRMHMDASGVAPDIKQKGNDSHRLQFVSVCSCACMSVCMHVWFRFDSGLAHAWFRCGSCIIQVWFRFGSILVQVWLIGSVLVQVWFRFGSVLVQVCCKFGSDLVDWFTFGSVLVPVWLRLGCCDVGFLHVWFLG